MVTRPNDIDEATWERAVDLNVDILIADTNEDEMRVIASALLSAKAEGMREAAWIAFRSAQHVNATADDISQAILSAIPKEPT